MLFVFRVDGFNKNRGGHMNLFGLFKKKKRKYTKRVRIERKKDFEKGFWRYQKKYWILKKACKQALSSLRQVDGESVLAKDIKDARTKLEHTLELFSKNKNMVNYTSPTKRESSPTIGDYRPGMLTVKQAAAVLGLKPATVTYYVHKNSIPVSRYNNWHLRFDEEKIKEWDRTREAR
jgi:hypothetical protein